MMKTGAIIVLAFVLLLSGCMQPAEPTPTETAPPTTAAAAQSGDDYKQFSTAGEVFDALTEAVSSMDASPSPGGGGQLIAKAADVPPGSTLEFTINGDNAILININGQYFAYLNKCTHMGGPSKLEGDLITCQWHGSQYKPQTGEVVRGPAAAPLTAVEVEVRGDGVWAK
jgi:nitrite reductase/ring-hydroxylating ferredoxin subunit